MNYTWKDTEQYIKVYEDNPEYGSTGTGKYVLIIRLVKQYGAKSVFDFGCGPNHSLLKKLKKESPGLKLRGYDPAIIASQENEMISSKIPDGYQADMIVSTDCMEHINEEELPQCWNIFNSINPRVMFINVCTRPAGQILPDGTNAHKTVKGLDWWLDTMRTGLPNYKVENIPHNIPHWKNHINILVTKI